MLTLARFDMIILLVAVAIGVAAGRWAFSKRRTPTDLPMKDPNQS